MSLNQVWWCVLAAPLWVGCGGAFTPGSGGSGAAAGAAAGGGAAIAGAPAGGGASGNASAGASCVYQGKSYAQGARFPAGDGCNSCTCEAHGSIACTEAACSGQCGALQALYPWALQRAKACDPKAQTNNCQPIAVASLPCGCQTPVNTNNVEALKELSALTEQAASVCPETLCAPCVPPPPATCSAAGLCEEAPFREQESACKVAGVVYPHGAGGIPDPTSCNSCSCGDGQLACTLIGCERPCPAGTKRATQCAQCGPTDRCEIVEHACLPTCTDDCANGVCLDGVCRNICG
ncbi:MAG TPA: hypothetical protein VJV79_22860 [Polyangiaceae bacterium]|nr:hypothetical protein [Polyangiaceae bacterium]